MRKNYAPPHPVRDVFGGFLVRGAMLDQGTGMPFFESTTLIPSRFITFSKAVSIEHSHSGEGADYARWVCFFEHDERFRRFLEDPDLFVPMLSKYAGVIAPDCSIGTDMPYPLQAFQAYCNHAYAYYLTTFGIQVATNATWGSPEVDGICFSGTHPGRTVVVGSHGCIKRHSERENFKRGLRVTLETHCPSHLVIYGRCHEEISRIIDEYAVPYTVEESEFARTHPRER